MSVESAKAEYERILAEPITQEEFYEGLRRLWKLASPYLINKEYHLGQDSELV